nr:Protein Y55B1AL.1 [Haemonchus contortus]
MKPSRTFFPQEIPVMLHRSPSGAKRKIRQRREEQGSRPSPFLASASASTSPTPSTASTTTPNESNYRSLIDSGAYQSILPDFDSSFVPVPQPRLNSTFSTSMSSLDITNTSLSSSSTPPPPLHTKPTVEVHPMPSEERNILTHDIEIKKEKPAVPAKPKNLKVDHLNRSTSMSSLASPISHTTSNFLNNFINSPSLVSLQQAYNSTDFGSQELKKIDEKRMESIGSANRRLCDYEDDRHAISDDMKANERNGEFLLSIIDKHDPSLANKVRRHLDHFKELLRFEMKLRCLMAKVLDHIRSEGEQGDVLMEESRLRRRLADVNFLRLTYARRERDLECAMSRFFEEEESRQWHYYKDTMIQLIQSEEQIRESIMDSKRHLRSLQNNRPNIQQ